MENNKIVFRGLLDKSVEGEESRTIEGLAIVFNRWSNDLGGFKEIIYPSAISQDLVDRSDIVAVCEHDPQNILARSVNGNGTLTLNVCDEGLRFRFDAPPTERGNELLYNIRNGNIFECSFAFCLPEDYQGERWYRENGELRREIHKIESLHDISMVVHGAYSDTYCYCRNLESVKEMLKAEDAKKDIETIEETVEERAESTVVEKDNISKENKETKKMEKRFSLVSTIRAIANNTPMDEVSLAVVNAGKEEMRKSGLAFGGQIQLPTENLRAISVANEAEDIVPTELWDIIEPLRSKNVLVAAGAKYLTNLVGNVQIPKMNASNCTWEGETESAQDGAPTFGHVTLSPKRLTTYVDVSKMLLNQDAIGVENMIREDIIKAINAKLESTILGAEEGTSTKPAGIFSIANSANTVSSVTSMEGIAEVEEKVEEANVIGDCKYVIAPSVKAKMRTLAKGGNIAQSLYVNGEIDGTEALSTTHVAKDKFVYGDFSNLAIGQWGVVDLTVDNFTQAKNGCVRLVVNAYFDAKVLEDKAFAFGTV